MIIRRCMGFYAGPNSPRSVTEIPHGCRLRRLTLHLDPRQSKLPYEFRVHVEGKQIVAYKQEDFLLHTPQKENSYRFDLFCETGEHTEAIIESDFGTQDVVQGRLAWEIFVERSTP